MPRVIELPPEEIARLTRPTSTIDLTPYSTAVDQLMSHPEAYGGGRIRAHEGEDMAVVKRRMTKAAHVHGLELKYKVLHDGRLGFVVLNPPKTESASKRSSRRAA